jgi:hypothetical protein
MAPLAVGEDLDEVKERAAGLGMGSERGVAEEWLRSG